MVNTVQHKDAVIALSGTKSAVVTLGKCSVLGFYTPANLVATAMTFEGAPEEGGAFVPVKDGAGNSISKTVAANQYIPLNPNDFAGIAFLKFVAGSTQTGAAAKIIAACGEVLS